MSRKTTRTHHRSSSSNRLSAFFKRPLVQLGIVAIAVLVIVAIVLVSNGQKPAQTAAGPTVISAAQAYQKYQQGNVFFLDVREPDEWNSGHIPNTTLIPLGELQNRLNELPKDKEIVVVCRTGHRSLQGAQTLVTNGFTNVFSMDGGVHAWGTAGYPFEGTIP
jgi:phage shock protein E